MKPRPRQKISNAPVYIGIMIFALLLTVLWFMTKGNFGSGSKPSGYCGYVVQDNLTLSEDIFCPADSLGKLPRGAPKPFVLIIQNDGITLDCNGHQIISEGGTGVVVEDAGDVTIRNCAMSGLDVSVSASNSIGLLVEKIKATTKVGGIEVINGQNTTLKESTLAAAGTESRWGVQFVGGKDATVSGCTISGYLFSGINFYGTSGFLAEKNHIFEVRDTGIGFFQKEGYPATEKGMISENTIEGIKNVGAFEVMHGTNDLTMVHNKISSSKSALFIYEKGNHGPVNKIHFTANTIDACIWPFHLTDCEDLVILENEINRTSGGGLATVRNAKNILFSENRFFLNNGAVAVGEKVEAFTLHRNHFTKHFGSFLRIETRPEKIQLVENDWDGCPAADRFEGIAFPDELNPVLLVFGEKEELYTLVDSDQDGKEDRGCGLD